MNKFTTRRICQFHGNRTEKIKKETPYYIEEYAYHQPQFRIWVSFEEYHLLEGYFLLGSSGIVGGNHKFSSVFTFPTNFGTNKYNVNENWFNTEKELQDFLDFLTAHGIKWL